MVDNKQIDRWLREGTITKEQADKMLQDASEQQREVNSNKFIIAISTIGSILLGVGAILFIASNWEVLPNVLKILILVGSTFGSYYAGYNFKYQKKNLPKVGSSLLFLGGILFGATLFLLAQIYNIEANNHTIVLIWLIGILPFVYVFTSVEMAGLASLLFYIWITLYAINDGSSSFPSFFGSSSETNNFLYLPVLYLVSGTALFGIGGLHYLSDRLRKVARIFRLSGLRAAILALFFLSFRFFLAIVSGGALPSDDLIIILTLLAVVAIITLFVNMIYNPSKSFSPRIEYYTGLLLVVLGLIFFNFPTYYSIHVLLFNLVSAVFIFFLLRQGYIRQDMVTVNLGISFFVVFFITKYFDFFWGLLDRSVFFTMGGLILIVGALFLERKSREMKARFIQHK